MGIGVLCKDPRRGLPLGAADEKRRSVCLSFDVCWRLGGVRPGPLTRFPADLTTLCRSDGLCARALSRVCGPAVPLGVGAVNSFIYSFCRHAWGFIAPLYICRFRPICNHLPTSEPHPRSIMTQLATPALRYSPAKTQASSSHALATARTAHVWLVNFQQPTHHSVRCACGRTTCTFSLSGSAVTGRVCARGLST